MSDRIMLMNGGKVEQLGTPNQLYFEPRTQFAADFIGASTLLDATLLASGQPASLKLQGGQTCRAFMHEDVAAGATGKLLLRPETLRLASPGTVVPGHNMANGTLASSLVTGGTSNHFVTLEGGMTVVVQELTNLEATRLEPGKPVAVVWPETSGRFLRT